MSGVSAFGQIAGGPPAGFVGQRRTTGAGIAAAGLFLLPAVFLFGLAARRSPAIEQRSTPDDLQIGNSAPL
jgi:hypothetical protein